MSTTFNCEDKDTLVAFLYDEIDDNLRRQINTHLRACAECADEVEGLRAVRRDLTQWQPPETELNFAITQRPATVLRPPRWSMPALPAWAQVAAAMLVFAAGAAIANVHVRYNSEGLSVTTGWMAPATAAVTAPPAAEAQDWRPALTALESDLRRELQSLRRAQTDPVRVASEPTALDPNVLMRRVDARISASEQRQREELAVRMTQFGRDVHTDLLRMNNGFRQLQGRTGAIEGNQRQMIDLVRRVQTQQVP
jgi:hypothetical protein